MACLFVGQLPFSKFFDADVYDLLEPYGRVVSVRMQHVKGEAFVCFESVNGADAAIAALHGQRTMKGRQRPLQLFYASSSTEWSWFGVLHNTRLHHLNPKVELPPFFNKTPPLAGSQWVFVPHPTTEATELVLPSTLHTLQAAAQAERDGDSDEQKSSTSSLRTTTSSSSLYSHDSSSHSAVRAGRAGHVGSGTRGVSTTLAGAKRGRPLPPSTSNSGDDVEAEAEAVKEGGASPVTIAVKAPKLTPAAVAGSVAHENSDEGGDEDANADALLSTSQRRDHPRTRTHRKTKLRIEDEENFAVLDEEDNEEAGVRLPTTAAASRAVLGSRTGSSVDSSNGSVSVRRSTTAPPPPATTTATVAAPVAASASSSAFRSRAAAPFSALPTVLEPHTETPSATFSSLEDADVVGTPNVVIRRRRSKATPTAVATTATARADALSARVLRGGMMPHHFHHRASHSQQSSSLSMSFTPGDSTTSTGSTSHDLSLAASGSTADVAAVTAAAAAAAASSSATRRAIHIATPHHHHHHHHLQSQQQQHNAVLPDEAVESSGVLGSAEATTSEEQRSTNNSSSRWVELNEPVLASNDEATNAVTSRGPPPPLPSSVVQEGVLSPIIPQEASQAAERVTWTSPTTPQEPPPGGNAKGASSAGRGRAGRERQP